MFIGGKRRHVSPVQIGGGTAPVIFTHVGITREFEDETELSVAVEREREKIRRAVALGAHAICDVSMNSNIAAIHRALLEGLAVPFGVVSVYETYVRADQQRRAPEAWEFLEDVGRQILRGADLVTLHATVFRGDRGIWKGAGRILPTTSRGGALMLELLEEGGYENPYYEHFEEILVLCGAHGVAVSLAPTYRPGSVADATQADRLHIMELRRMARLVEAARKAGVAILIEGIGHASLRDIPRLIDTAKSLCPGAAYRVMPVATDAALGFDHISSAIAAAVAVQYGADSITCVTRKEHIGVPTLADVEEGVAAARIAAHAGYIARTGDFTRDIQISESRRRQGCLGNPAAALFPEAARGSLEEGGSCSMCGAFCPLKKIRAKE